MKHPIVVPALAIASVFFSTSAVAGSIADKAIADIVAAQTKLHALHSLAATVTVSTTIGGHTQTQAGTVKCLKPNYIWIETAAGGHRAYHISDGKDYCTNGGNGKWTSVKADAHGANFRNDLLLWSDFYVLYATDNAKHLIDGADVAIDHRSIDDVRYEVITATRKASPSPHTAATTVMSVAIGPDGLIHRMSVDGGGMRMVDTWSVIKQNPPLRPADFKPKD